MGIINLMTRGYSTRYSQNKKYDEIGLCEGVHVFREANRERVKTVHICNISEKMEDLAVHTVQNNAILICIFI